MRYFLLAAALIAAQHALALEFNAQVRINTPKLQTADPRVFQTLQTALTQLINNTAWTNDDYESFEKIEMSININITKEVSATSFIADLAIQATRPIYNSDQQTVLFSNSDPDVVFDYVEYEPIEYTRNAYSNNLTSIVSFYCYMVLGLDADSFAPLGGTVHFQEAQNIIATIPPALVNALPGWNSVSKLRNRYWLIENILSPRVEPFRTAMYDYHLQGLDRMADDPATGRQAIINAITKINQVNRAYRNAMIVQIFSNVKRTEIISIFMAADAATRTKIYEAMIAIDASNAANYNVLK